MAAEDYLPFDFCEDDIDFFVTCKNCNKPALSWEEVRGRYNRKKWVLVDGAGDIHDCRGAASAEEFPVVRT